MMDWTGEMFYEIGEFYKEVLGICEMFVDPIKFLFGLDASTWKTIYKTILLI